jgi:hypothetical protein
VVAFALRHATGLIEHADVFETTASRTLIEATKKMP